MEKYESWEYGKVCAAGILTAVEAAANRGDHNLDSEQGTEACQD